MVAIYIRPEGNASKAHFANPINFSVKRQVLQNAEGGDAEAKKHSKPYEPFPIFEGAKGLGREKEYDGVGEQQLQFRACCKDRRGEMENPLDGYDQRQNHQRQHQWGNYNLLFFEKIAADGPSDKQKSGARFKHGARPSLHTAVSGNSKNEERANADFQKFHGWAV